MFYNLHVCLLLCSFIWPYFELHGWDWEPTNFTKPTDTWKILIKQGLCFLELRSRLLLHLKTKTEADIISTVRSDKDMRGNWPVIKMHGLFLGHWISKHSRDLWIHDSFLLCFFSFFLFLHLLLSLLLRLVAKLKHDFAVAPTHSNSATVPQDTYNPFPTKFHYFSNFQAAKLLISITLITTLQQVTKATGATTLL